VIEPPATASKASSAGARAWELMYEVFRASKPFLEVVAAGFEMTPQQLYALRQLSDQRPLTMSQLATSLGCDASNVTSIVDKLESRGLVERRSADHDRRVKGLFVTDAGVALRARVEERMQQPPPAIDNLSTKDQETLCVLLQRALDSL
jgi:DNA-binding MarR family transcriptional regulator